jgi:uncharacterized protein YjbI with pentapeptide repeats
VSAAIILLTILPKKTQAMTEKLAVEQHADPNSERWPKCPRGMYAAGVCGRPIHSAPVGVDKEAVCLMHSRDPHKGEPGLTKRFEQEIETILQEANGLADFSQFIFPRISFHRRVLEAKCIFQHATFTAYADFSGTMFVAEPDFSDARFIEDAHFHGATFKEGADFSGSSVFLPNNPNAAKFKKTVFFQHTTFIQNAKFGFVEFEGDVAFDNSAFLQEASFVRATFIRDVSFASAKFSQDANFRETKFAQLTDFGGAQFLGSARFRETEFREDQALIPGPIFSSTIFSNPEAVSFYRTNLTHAIFFGCDVSRMNFFLVDWRTRSSNAKRMVFEEVASLRGNFAGPLEPETKEMGERNFRLIEQVYHQLKKNYDDKGDYWTAGDFHYGEMEMKRMDDPKGGRLFKLRRWAHRRFGLVAWYKYASEYGESYTRSLVILGLALVIFASLFPAVGLQHNLTRASQTLSAPSPLTYLHPVPAGSSSTLINGELFLWGNSFLSALSIAVFQKDLAYTPAYPWGTLLALLETLVTSTIFALFLLAIRRQFRR